MDPETRTDVGTRRRRGRPESAATRRSVLDAAAQLLDQRGLAGFSVDEVARRSKVSKSTIYRHWSGGLAIAVEAYGARVTDAVPVSVSGDPEADLIDQVRRVAALYAGPSGKIIAQLLGAGAAVEGGAEMVRDGLFAQRRAESLRLVDQGMADGLWSVEFDPELLIELLFGPIVFRAVNGQEPLDPDDAVALAKVVLRGLRPGRSEPALPISQRSEPGGSR